MRKLGISAGRAGLSTALYYEHINRGIARRLGGLHSARLVIESLDLAPFAEMELSGDWDGVAQVTLDAPIGSRRRRRRGDHHLEHRPQGL